MTYVLLEQKLPDYQWFNHVFSADSHRRKLAGSLGGRVFRSPSDPDGYLILLEFSDTEAATRFAQSPYLHEAMKWAGDQPPLKISVLDPLIEMEA
jgi:hypothetical protein